MKNRVNPYKVEEKLKLPLYDGTVDIIQLKMSGHAFFMVGGILLEIAERKRSTCNKLGTI
jgi:hypothetical protein